MSIYIGNKQIAGDSSTTASRLGNAVKISKFDEAAMMEAFYSYNSGDTIPFYTDYNVASSTNNFPATGAYSGTLSICQFEGDYTLVHAVNTEGKGYFGSILGSTANWTQTGTNINSLQNVYNIDADWSNYSIIKGNTIYYDPSIATGNASEYSVAIGLKSTNFKNGDITIINKIPKGRYGKNTMFDVISDDASIFGQTIDVPSNIESNDYIMSISILYNEYPKKQFYINYGYYELGENIGNTFNIIL